MFIHSPTHGPLGRFQPLAASHKAPVNICMQCLCEDMLSFLIGNFLEAECLGHMVDICLSL